MIAAVVLAAGASTRFGSPKQAVLLEPVLTRVRSSAEIGDIVAVLGAHDVESTSRAVHCPDWHRGPRSEERRVGKECRAQREQEKSKEKKENVRTTQHK